MRHWWWKILAVVILLYVLVVGMITPLKPGVLTSFPVTAKENSNITLNVTGYNTHFATANNNTAYLKRADNKVIKATKVNVKDEQNITLNFLLPTIGLTKKGVTLLINNDKDGNIILPNAIVVQTSEANTKFPANWSTLDVSQLSKYDGFAFPFRNILHETVRNTFFHVAIWFAMFTLFVVGLIYSIRYLLNRSFRADTIAQSFTYVGVMFGLVGLATGSMWAKHTWGAYWTSDVKLNMSAVAVLIYLAYAVLRNSIQDVDSKARISAVYNIFAFAVLIPLIFVIPRLTDSLHPGNGGNPALGGEDMENTLRIVFYPAIIGLTLIGVWIAELGYRIEMLKNPWKKTV